MMLTDFYGHDEMRDTFGKVLVFILGVTVSINFLRLLIKIITSAR